MKAVLQFVLLGAAVCPFMVSAQDPVTGMGSGTDVDKDNLAPCRLERLFDNGDRRMNNGRVSGGMEVFESGEVHYNCVEGHTLVDSNSQPLNTPFTRTCIRGGPDPNRQLIWDRPQPVCQPIVCAEPAVPANGQRIGNRFQYEDVVTFTCDDGYALVGSRRRVCRDDGTFSGSVVSCRAQFCQDPGTVQFASRQLEGMRIGHTSTYQCEPGYVIRGQAQLTCLPSLQWSHPLPSCEPRACCRLEAPLNGRKIGDAVSFGSTARFECNSGYELTGSEQRQCQTDATWSGDPAQCVPIMCPIPRQIANGGYTGNGFSVSNQLSFYCNTGHQLAGAEILTCQADGTWDRPLPTCMVVDCGNPGRPENGARDGDVFTYTSHAMFSCDEGYRLLGSAVRFCLADGTWSGEPAVCNLGSCGDPGTPVNGARTMTGTTKGDTVDWTCDGGYRLVGGPAAECQSNGQWSRPTPTCERIMCVNPGRPLNGARIGENFFAGSSVQFTCDVGFMMQGSPSIDCLTTGRWSDPVPTCVAMKCADPGRPENGFRIQEGNTLNSVTRFECNPGYELNGPPMRTCVQPNPSLDAVRWDQSVPTCVPVQCQNPGVPDNGARQGDVFTFTSVVAFTCDSGFMIRGAPSLLCLASGQWSQPRPTCEPVRCPTPAMIQNGRSLYTTVMYQDQVMFQCDVGFVLEGQPSATCQANGQWNNPPPVCVRGVCPDPGVPDNGYRNLDSLTIGSEVKFFCNPGYSLNGSPDRQCLPAGTWSNSVPTCELISCANPGVPANGRRQGNDFSFASSVSFQCDVGYVRDGADLLTCMASGQWSRPVPTCRVIDCGQPEDTINGRTMYISSTYGSAANYVCNDGYERDGPDSATCGVDGQWSKRPPACRKVNCPDPGTPANGGRALTGREYQDTVTFSCNAGFRMENAPDGVVTCLANGQWSHPTPTCQPRRCDDPGMPVYGTRQITQGIQRAAELPYLYRDTVMWTCDLGHRTIGNPSAVCQADGTWSNSPPQCQPIQCADPGTPINGARVLEGLTLGNQVSFTCNEGFNMVGQPSAVCLPIAQWSQPLPACEPIECQMIASPSNGGMNMTNIQYLGEAQFGCDPGFELVGAQMLVCTSSGEWSGLPPQCEEKFCSDPGIPANGQRTAQDFSVGGMLQYVCNEGFSMNGAAKLTCKTDEQWDLPVPTCDPDCLLDEWSPWPACSVTCGDGNQQRTRQTNQQPSGVGKPCDPDSENRPCILGSCVVCDGQFEEEELTYRVQQIALIPVTDVLIVVDESRSMDREHAWLPNMIRLLETSLNDVGIGLGEGQDRSRRNLYSLVGFGKSPDPLAHTFTSTLCSGQTLYPFECYASANAKLEADIQGRIEDGYEAMKLAIDMIPWRRGEGIAHNMIFISDEDRDVVNTSISRAVIKSMLLDNGFVLNAVIDNKFFDSSGGNLLGIDNSLKGYRSRADGTYEIVQPVTIDRGYARTRNDYTDLALELRGASWDINLLRGGDQSASFTNAFKEVKTAEIRRQTDRCNECTCRADGAAVGGGAFQCVESTNTEVCRCRVLEGRYNQVTEQCDDAKPAVNCEVSAWGAFTDCSVTCGQGFSSRKRTITVPAQAGGTPCPVLEERRLCVMRPCSGSGCEDPGTPANGRANLLFGQSFPVQPGASVNFFCNAGYRLLGSTYADCGIDFTWSYPLPTCQALCLANSRRYDLQSNSPGVATDMVLVVDQSRSMGNEIQWLKDIIPRLNTRLESLNIGTEAGCPNQFAVVGYGSGAPGETGRLFQSRSGNRLFSVAEYASAVANLREDQTGRIEDGYEAMSFALENIPLRTSNSQCSVARNLLLLTDEDRDRGRLGQSITTNVMRQRLSSNLITLNVIVDNAFTVDGVRGIGRTAVRGFREPTDAQSCYRSSGNVQTQAGYGNTRTNYTDLALGLGGGAWDILQLRNTAIREAMSCAIVNVKVDEISGEFQQCRICDCSGDGAERCVPTTGAQREECYCGYSEGIWRNGACINAPTRPTPQQCLLSEWTPWSPCQPVDIVSSCGPGVRTRSRQPETAVTTNCGHLYETLATCADISCTVLPECRVPGQTTFEDNTGLIAVAADILIVVDESSSMDTEHSWLPGMVENLETQMQANSIGTTSQLPNMYALVGFGRSGRRNQGAAAETLFSSSGASLFPSGEYALVNEQLIADLNGSLEDGYQAVMHALDTVAHRRNPAVALNVILITDEDRDTLTGAAGITRAIVKQRILQEGAVLNVVVDNSFRAYNGTPALGVDSFGTGYLALGESGEPSNENIQIGAGYGRTRSDYTELALETGGAAWDINLLRGGGDVIQRAFTTAFTRVKTSEVKQRVAVCRRCQCSPDLKWLCTVDSSQEKCQCRAKYNENTVEALKCLLDVDLPDCPPEPNFVDPAPRCPVECLSTANCSSGETCCRKGCSSTCEDAFDCATGDVNYRTSPSSLDVAADMVMVVDESRSMEGEHLWLRSMVRDLEDQLLIAGIGTDSLRNHYMLVGFGHRLPNQGAHYFEVNGQRAVRSELVDRLLTQLRADDDGFVEDGYQALLYAMDVLPIRRGDDRVPLNIIFVSDEDRDLVNRTYGSRITKQLIEDRLLREGASLNMVLDQEFQATEDGDRSIGMDSNGIVYLSLYDGGYTQSAIGTQTGRAHNATRQQYTELAWRLNGAAWDINKLRQGGRVATSFTRAFTDVKTKEVISRSTTCQRCGCGFNLFWDCRPDNSQERCRCNIIGKRWSDQLQLCVG